MAKDIFSPVHLTTPAEAALLAVIQQHVASLSSDGTLPLIDFDFLRDATVQMLQSKLMNLGKRAYTEQACLCVGQTRYYYRNRHISQLKYTKMN